jgi:ketosteroid isomerase-like protein
MDDAAARALMRSWWDRVWGDGDLDALDDLLTDPYIRHASAGTETITPARYKLKLVQYQRTLHKAVTTVDDEVVVGDKIWTRATSRGLNLETGELAVFTWMTIHRIEGGRLAEGWISAIAGVDWERT